MDDAPLASLSLTHVHYNPADPISYLCAYLALVPQGLCVTYITLIWATREVEVILMFAGQMGCEALNFALKRLIKEERPRQMNGKGYGMPSSHAQFLAFYSVSLTLFLLYRHALPPSHSTSPPSNSPTPLLPRAVVSLMSVIMAVLVAASRIYLNYHTPRQVLVGCTAGAVLAVAWFTITEWFRSTGWLHWVLDLYVCRALRIRDLAVEEDLVEAGWREWESKRKRRRGIDGKDKEFSKIWTKHE
ncbi:MAG: hypothetical protein Q9187_001276 [Circinaria calcarea]